MTVAVLGVSLLLVRAPVAFANCATDDPDGSKTLAARQQVATDCTCDHGSPPTVNHGQYVKCAANVATTRSGLAPADANFLPKTCKGAVKKCAAHSTCGKPGFVTCCITTTQGTTCKIKKDAASCTAKNGTIGTCASCCDACPPPGGGPSCPATTATTTTTTVAGGTTTTTTTLPCGTVLAEWGGHGIGPGQFDGLAGIAVDPFSHQHVYAVDSNNDRIEEFNVDGSFVTQWGSLGTGNGEFSSPADVAVDGNSNVYVADMLNHRVQKFDHYGNFILAWGSQGSADGAFIDPSGIAVDSGNNVLVADRGNNRIQMFFPDGTFRTKWGMQGTGNGEFNGPLDVAGEYFVADTGNQRVQVFALVGFQLDATFLREWPVAGPPASITLGLRPNGSTVVYVADEANTIVYQFDPNGALLNSWSPSGGPRGLATSSIGDGIVYVANAATNTIQKFYCF